MATRNTTWTYEELVLAYAAYTKVRDKSSVDFENTAGELSKRLRKLAEDAGVEISDTFRNFNGVNMKLRNFEGAESGGVNGLKFTKRELEVVDRFKNDQAALAREASRAAKGQKIWQAPNLNGIPASYSVEKLAEIDDDMVRASQDPLPIASTLVHPQTHSLGKICKDEQNLRIPPHQRSYAWTVDQVEEFISDVQELATSVAADKTSPQHFFGGIVLVRTSDQSGWDIIDGQQRLTTFALSLAVLQTAFERVALIAAGEDDEVTKKSGELYASMLHDEFLWTREVDPVSGEPLVRPRITPNERDVKAFEAILASKSVPADRESQKLLVEARDQLASQLTDPLLSASRSAKKILRSLVTLQYALLKCCIVIQLSAIDSSAAYRLFMVLNDRGLDLSEGDLLRAITLEALDPFPSQQQQAAELWDQVLGEPADDVKAFLRSFYPSVYGERIDIWKVVDIYRDKLFKVGAVTGVKQARQLVAQLEQMQDELLTFKMLRAGTWPLALPPGTKGYGERVRRLVRTLKHDLATPLLLAGAKQLTPLQFGKLVILLERFAFRYKNIGRGHAGKAAETYYAHAKYIRGLADGGRYSMSNFRGELAALIGAGDDDELFMQELRQRLQYSQSGQRGNIRWLLAAIEDFGPWLADKNRPHEPELSTTFVFDVESAHIDHIYPQNPKPGQDDPDLDDVKHSLGNLVLLEQKPNRIASNAPFKDKRSFYARTKLSETTAVGRKRTWKVTSVEDREVRLAKSAVILTKL
jgi:hypothetical protein